MASVNSQQSINTSCYYAAAEARSLVVELYLDHDTDAFESYVILPAYISAGRVASYYIGGHLTKWCLTYVYRIRGLYGAKVLQLIVTNLAKGAGTGERLFKWSPEEGVTWYP